MVWFRTKEPGIGLFRSKTTKFIKKFKNGKPDLNYFGSGMSANYLYDPTQFEIKACEIFPTISKPQDISYIVTEAPRSFEIYKDGKSDVVRLIIRSVKDDVESYAKSLKTDYEDADLSILEFPENDNPNNKTYFFDFELSNQFNFTSLESGQEPISDRLIRAISSAKKCNVVLQFLFSNIPNWNETALRASLNLSRFLKATETGRTRYRLTGFDNHFLPRIKSNSIPDVAKISSFSYHSGKLLEKLYFQKATSRPISMSIRGMITGTDLDIYPAISSISAVFSNIRFVGDHLEYFDYEINKEHGLSWLKSNNIASTYALEIFKKSPGMWSNMEWGRGRDFIPFLCLTPQEFSIFVSMPSDNDLPISYRRKKIKGLNSEKLIFPLGTTMI